MQNSAQDKNTTSVPSMSLENYVLLVHQCSCDFFKISFRNFSGLQIKAFHVLLPDLSLFIAQKAFVICGTREVPLTRHSRAYRGFIF